MSEAADNPLEFIPLQDLIDEIKRRHQATFITMLGHPKTPGDDGVRCDSYNGEYHTIIGMVEGARHMLIRKFRKATPEDHAADDHEA